MNRRDFVATVLGVITAGVARPFAWRFGPHTHEGSLGSFGCIAPGTVVSVPDGLMFHKDAFAFAMAPLEAVEERGNELFVVSGGRGYVFKVPEDWAQ